MTNPELDALLVELDLESGWRQIIEQHRKVTDDKKITYVLKDGTRIHEDESVVAALAASFSRALEQSSDVSARAIAAIRALRAENERLREALLKAQTALAAYEAAHDQDGGSWSLASLHEAEALASDALLKTLTALGDA